MYFHRATTSARGVWLVARGLYLVATSQMAFFKDTVISSKI